MKIKPIIPDPLTFLRAGINSMQQAAVLVHVGRTGLQGSRINQVTDATGISASTVQGIACILQDSGLLTRFARSNSRGRHYHWVVTVKGWDLLTTSPDLGMFAGAADIREGVK
jgi:DNA-binding MarR family transcriptional regulator